MSYSKQKFINDEIHDHVYTNYDLSSIYIINKHCLKSVDAAPLKEGHAG